MQTVEVLNKDILLISKLLQCETRRKILKVIFFINPKGWHIALLANILNKEACTISAHIKKLESANLIETYFVVGKHGDKKICKLKYEKLILEL